MASERAPPGRKEKRFPTPKRPRSLGAAMLPAQCLPGQLGLSRASESPSDPRARSPPGAATGSRRARRRLGRGGRAGAGAGAGVRRGGGAGRGAGRGAGARIREEAEPEAEVRVKDPPDSGARGLPTPLGLVPRPEPGGRCPWRGPLFLQQKSSVCGRCAAAAPWTRTAAETESVLRPSTPPSLLLTVPRACGHSLSLPLGGAGSVPT